MATELEQKVANGIKRDSMAKIAEALEAVSSAEDKARVLAAVAILFDIDGKLIEALGQ